MKEIQQVWKAVKEVTKFRSKVSNSALEIARKAGWDDNVSEIETRVTTAIAALEDAGYLKRGQNMPRVFANSILCENAQEAIEKINASERFSETQKEKGIRIIKKLFSSKSRKQATDEQAESRVDYISDHLGIVREEVIKIITLLREERILSDTKDLTAFIKRGENKNRSLHTVTAFSKIEQFMLPIFSEEEKTFHLKEINEQAEEDGCENVNINQIKTIINFWAIKNWIKRKTLPFSRNHIAALCIQPHEVLQEKLRRRHEVAKFIVEYLYEKSTHDFSEADLKCEEVLVEFSVHELKNIFEASMASFGQKISIEDVEDTLFYLSRIEAIKIEGGFLVVYNRLTIDRLEQDNKKRYKADDYQKLNQFYENKVQQIHIVGEYAKKMIEDKNEALQFVEDYFHLNYNSFLNQHFKGSRQDEIKRNITPAKFKQLFGELSDKQLEIIKDKDSKYIVVAAGPGSGKTRVLVHKLASLLLMEDVKHEQLLMLTFSRAAATEFKMRLLKLIGNAANFIEIKTFHSYCFDLLGRIGSLDKSDDILKKALERIKNKEVEASRITKTVLVIDEAQDMDEDEFNLIKALIEQNEDMRVIAVGDDDQNIYEFRGANSKYLEELIRVNNAAKYELIDNYRSKQNLVDFANQFALRIHHRLKDTPIHAIQADNGHIKLVRHHSDNLVTPLVQDILSARLTGTICVLTKTNDEASQIAGVLLKNGVQAQLIQSNEGFGLFNMLEIRDFLSWIKQADDDYSISDEVWSNAKQDLESKFHNSNKLEICLKLIKDFETTNPKKKYKSDLDVFIRESKLEDFLSENIDTIYVSTIHKVKGKEFDNVFLMLDKFKLETEEDKRQLYVAITRAKQNLNIHLNSDFLDSLSVENMERIEDGKTYLPPEELVLPLTHKEIWLNGFTQKQHLVSQLSNGEILTVNDSGCSNLGGQSILKFSKKFMEKQNHLRTMGYELTSAKVNFIVYWQNDEMISEIKIVLPELHFKKVSSQPL